MGDALRRQFLMLLVLFAGGALCAVLYDVAALLRKWIKHKAALWLLDAIWIVLCSAILLYLWYRLDRLHVHWLPFFSAALGAFVYRLGLGTYVGLCLEKRTDTRYCAPLESAKKL